MRRPVVPLIAAVAVLFGASPAVADTFDVTSTADGAGTCTGGSCTTIRAALAAAAANGADGSDTIDVPAGTYALTQAAGGQLDIEANVTIAGASAATTTIEGDGANFRVVGIGPGRTVSLSHLTLQSGAALTDDDPAGGGVRVGAGANASFDHVHITQNKALRGAGVAVVNGSATITDSMVDGNSASAGAGGTAGDGGGILVLGVAGPTGASTLSLTDSTVALNSAVTGAGIMARDNAANSTALNRATVAYNASATTRGGGLLLADAETFSVQSSLVAKNTGNVGTVDAPVLAETNCGALAPADGGADVDSGNDCGFTLPSDRQSVDAQVSDQPTTTGTGGETPVLALAPTSPAVDLYSCSGALTDQRDLGRPQGALCDAGAYELEQAPPDTAIASGPSGPTDSASASFAFSSPQPATTFECRLDGPGDAVGGFAPCASPNAYSGLADGAYTFMVRAVNHLGHADATPASQSFTVTTVLPAMPAQTPAPAPAPTPAPAPIATVSATPTAVFHQRVVIAPNGLVQVQTPGATLFAPVLKRQAIPLGSVVATGRHTVALTVLPSAGGKPATIELSGGTFKVTQPGTTTLVQLVEPLAPCGHTKKTDIPNRPKTRELSADGAGSFEIRGLHSTATIRGSAAWVVQDSCSGTLTRVTRGLVSVNDLTRHKSVLLKSGKRYLARPKR
jgi:hypothetical protein